jgi:hypothetical protein
LFFLRHQGLLAARRQEGRWEQYEKPDSRFQHFNLEAIRRNLRTGRYVVRDPRHQVLEIGGDLVMLEEAESFPAVDDCALQAAKDPCAPAPAAPR